MLSSLKAISAEIWERAIRTVTTQNKQCEIVVFPQESNLQPSDYRLTALPLELEKASPRVLNFGYLNSATCLFHGVDSNVIAIFWRLWGQSFNVYVLSGLKPVRKQVGGFKSPKLSVREDIVSSSSVRVVDR